MALGLSPWEAEAIWYSKRRSKTCKKIIEDTAVTEHNKLNKGMKFWDFGILRFIILWFGICVLEFWNFGILEFAISNLQFSGLVVLRF